MLPQGRARVEDVAQRDLHHGVKECCREGGEKKAGGVQWGERVGGGGSQQGNACPQDQLTGLCKVRTENRNKTRSAEEGVVCEWGGECNQRNGILVLCENA